MTTDQQGAGVVGVSMEKVTGSTSTGLTDAVSVEEPLEIRLTANISELAQIFPSGRDHHAYARG